MAKSGPFWQTNLRTPPPRPAMSIVAVQVPMGIPPGGQFLAIAPNGAQMMVVNPGVPPGSVIHVRCPPPPMPVYGGPQPSSMERVAPAPPPPTEALKPDDIPADAEIASATVPGFTKTTLAEAPKQEELCPCAACCCVTYSIYPVFPDCMGAYCKGVACMCIEVEQLLCKVSKTEGVFCKVKRQPASVCLLKRAHVSPRRPTRPPAVVQWRARDCQASRLLQARSDRLLCRCAHRLPDGRGGAVPGRPCRLHLLQEHGVCVQALRLERRYGDAEEGGRLRREREGRTESRRKKGRGREMRATVQTA